MLSKQRQAASSGRKKRGSGNPAKRAAQERAATEEPAVGTPGDGAAAFGFGKEQQTPQGHWEGVVLNLLADMEGGATALVTLALLNCGVKPTEKSVRLGLEYLSKLPPKKTYVVGLQTMAFLEARDPKYKPQIQINANWLIETGHGLKAGRLTGWGYGENAGEEENHCSDDGAYDEPPAPLSLANTDAGAGSVRSSAGT